MQFLIHPSYFPSIPTFALLTQYECIWEICDNYQKQTYRNRCYICTDQGKLMLTIPIQHVGGAQGKQFYKDVKIENQYNWQRQHWRTLQTAYRASPFFEYYEDDLAPLFTAPFKFLMDFNFKTIELVCDCLQLKMPVKRTSTYELTTQNKVDARFLVNAKNQLATQQPPYQPVFGEKHGFIDNLSILDLLFNEGTATLSYLEDLPLSFSDA